MFYVCFHYPSLGYLEVCDKRLTANTYWLPHIDWFSTSTWRVSSDNWYKTVSEFQLLYSKNAINHQCPVGGCLYFIYEVYTHPCVAASCDKKCYSKVHFLKQQKHSFDGSHFAEHLYICHVILVAMVTILHYSTLLQTLCNALLSRYFVYMLHLVESIFFFCIITEPLSMLVLAFTKQNTTEELCRSAKGALFK